MVGVYRWVQHRLDKRDWCIQGARMSIDINELAAKVAALEERTNTKQAEYETGLARLSGQIAERDKERDYRVLVWMAVLAGIIIAALRL